ncbi:MAG: thioredoxin family protein [Anaerotignaceae bacterium]
MIRELDCKNFDEAIIGKAVVDFYQSDCTTCEKFAPVFEKIAEIDQTHRFFKVNLDEDLTLAKRYALSHIPAVLIFENGEKVKETSGYLSEEQLAEFIGGAQ